MPLLDVCLEVAAADEAAACADENAHLCDVCHHQRGSSWVGLYWVCALCRVLQVMLLERERVA